MASFSYDETYTNIVQLIHTILAKDISKVMPETTLQDLAIDSLDLVELVIEIEDQFHCHIDDAKVENLSTVGDIAHYVYSLIKN